MRIKPFGFSPGKPAFVSAAWMLSAIVHAQPLPLATPESVGMSSQRLEKGVKFISLMWLSFRNLNK